MPGSFNTSNDDWRLMIRNSGGGLVYGPSGEGSPFYTGGNVNSREIFRLEAHPSPSVTPASPHDDGNHSTFGSFNRWTDQDTQCKVFHDYSALRQALLNECATCSRLILNGYNAVGDLLFLNGGDAIADIDGGLAADSFFGRVAGNGGDWIEFVVIEDHLDARGWSFEWDELGPGGRDGKGAVDFADLIRVVINDSWNLVRDKYREIAQAHASTS